MKAVIAIVTTLLFIVASATSQSKLVLLKEWGEFGAKAGQFKFPSAIATDSHYNIYVVDQHNHRIQKFDSAGNFILMWGKQGGGQDELYYPYGIAVDSRDNIYVSDMNNNRVQKFTNDGKFIASVGSYGSSDGQFRYPYGIAIDKNDMLYVIDAFNYRIQKFSADLAFAGQWGSQDLFGIKLYMPHELAFNDEGNILFSDRQNHRIVVFSKDGRLITRFGEYGEGKDAPAGRYSEPHGIAINKNGDIFICDRYNYGIHMLNSKYQANNKWFTSGNFDNSRHFPIAITASKDGTLYVVDNYAHTVQRYKLY